MYVYIRLHIRIVRVCAPKNGQTKTWGDNTTYSAFVFLSWILNFVDLFYWNFDVCLICYRSYFAVTDYIRFVAIERATDFLHNSILNIICIKYRASNFQRKNKSLLENSSPIFWSLNCKAYNRTYTNIQFLRL